MSLWTTVSDSEFPWEREALAYIKERLPEHEPFRAWSNFEFIADDGSINEVDLLVVSTHKVFLVEIKSRPGRLTGDAGTWIWTNDRGSRTTDNPIFLANRKAKKLKSLLSHQGPLRKARVPYVEAIVFLSARDLRCELPDQAMSGVYLREDAHQPSRPDIMRVLLGETDQPRTWRIDASLSRAIGRAMDMAGIRRSTQGKRIGDYVLEKLLWDGNTFQDWEGTHSSLTGTKRRIRLYPNALQASDEAREASKKAAQREFQLLEGISHPGILRASEFTMHERGPALLFEHDPTAQRLDLFLRERHDQLDVAARLRFVREIAEALQFAHRQRLFHRALSPQTILVTAPDSAAPIIKLFDWQTAKRLDDSETSRHTQASTLHAGLLGDPQTELYMAPEAMAGLDYDPVKLDVFSLGAITYHVFSGHAPASSIQELHEKCANGPGLQISDVLDGAVQALQELILSCTHPQVECRMASIDEFLDYLDYVDDELAEDGDEHLSDPTSAQAGDRLEGGFLVKKRLGKGSTSVALLVERDGREGVLKVALDFDQNERLRKEGEVLLKLRHQHIVELYEVVNVSGHVALFMAAAGVGQSLAQRIRDEGRLSLDLLERFGQELLVAVEWLEDNGVSHRDIKPDNIGIGMTRSDRLTLVLFDFSLSGTPVENLWAGTVPYLDPFLRLRKPPRWDLYAERFAAAMTLYEMATGTLPQWGDGQSAPSMLDVEASLDVEMFDAAIRDDLADFFAKALARDYRERFDTAEEMLKAWRRVFAKVDQPSTTSDHDEPFDIERMLADVTAQTSLGSLGLSPRLLNALERIGAHTVGELATLPRIRLYRNKGIGHRTVRQIRELADQIAQKFAGKDVSTGSKGHTTDKSDGPIDDRLLSIDQLAARLVSNRIDKGDAALLQCYLGLDKHAKPWLPQREVAELQGTTWSRVQDVLHRARERWSEPWMTALRQDLAGLLERHGGIATGLEMAKALLSARGSFQDEPDRTRAAIAVTYAALETEFVRDGARFVLYRGSGQVLVVATPQLGPQFLAASDARAQYAEALGAKADTLATADPLLAPSRVIEELQAIPAPEGDPVLPVDRLVRLAVAAASQAALSSRMELYPRAMSAIRALRLGAGSLYGPKALSVQQLQQRIASRYPEAEPLPGRPDLDRMLQDAGIELVWDLEALDGKGAYRPRGADSKASSLSLHRLSTSKHGADLPSPEVESASVIEARLNRAVEERRLLVLTVAPKYLLEAEAEVQRRFPVERVSLEALLIKELRAAVAEIGATWDVVCKADGAAPNSVDWRNLQSLIRRVMPTIESTLISTDKPVLLVNCGLLARYDQVGLFERLREASTRKTASTPGFVVLVPDDEISPMPTLDGQAIPVINPSDWGRIPEAWLRNWHRANLTPNPLSMHGKGL